tara:strand:- start:518 stop:1276 length:759 start_codon:yes stop_codon:yes gene_type:complete
MGRRSNEQICLDLRKERSNLYSKRTRVLKKSASKKNDKAYNAIEKRLDAIREQLFRCGKKYSSFKKQRTKLRRHQYYLQLKVKKIREKLNDPNIKGKERKDLVKEMNVIGTFKLRTGEEIQMIETVMKLPIGNVKTSMGVDKGIVSLKSGRFAVQDIIWVMTESWNKWLSSGYFVTLVLDDEMFDLTDNPMVATAAVYAAYDWALSWQHVYGTPFFFAFGDATNGYLEIKIKEYTSDLYSDEINKYKGDIEG